MWFLLQLSSLGKTRNKGTQTLSLRDFITQFFCQESKQGKEGPQNARLASQVDLLKSDLIRIYNPVNCQQVVVRKFVSMQT